MAAGCGEPDHPVFLLSQHKPVHRRTFARGMIFLLAAACGRPFDHFGTHSLRRGGAQALRDAGAPPWVVQLLGRWSSDAYKRYCDTGLNVVLDWTQRMGVEHDALHHDDLVLVGPVVRTLSGGRGGEKRERETANHASLRAHSIETSSSRFSTSRAARCSRSSVSSSASI